MSSSVLLELHGVGKDYGSQKNAVHALRGVSLSICAGDFLAITGPSGGGKSTLLNVMGTLHRPSFGRFLLFDRDVSKYGRVDLARLRNRHFGFVFQDSLLVSSLTVLENVCLPLVYAGMSRTERRRRARSVLEELGLGHRSKHLPSELSGGECQRVALGRAIINRPRVILADEPTGNLDQENTKNIMRILDGLHQSGATVVVVSHDPEVVARCTATVTLVDGRLVDPPGSGS